MNSVHLVVMYLTGTIHEDVHVDLCNSCKASLRTWWDSATPKGE